jgi:hypothetical protein
MGIMDIMDIMDIFGITVIYLEVRVPRKGDHSDISRSEGAAKGRSQCYILR